MYLIFMKTKQKTENTHTSTTRHICYMRIWNLELS